MVSEKYFTNAMPEMVRLEFIAALLLERMDAPVKDIATALHAMSPKFVTALSWRAS